MIGTLPPHYADVTAPPSSSSSSSSSSSAVSSNHCPPHEAACTPSNVSHTYCTCSSRSPAPLICLHQPQILCMQHSLHQLALILLIFPILSHQTDACMEIKRSSN
eukprot:765269-Hanusia_phi.AAC.9